MLKPFIRVGLFLVLGCLLAPRGDAAEAVRVGVYQNPPKVFTSPDGRITGIFPEILEEIAARRGWTIDYVPGTWQEGLDRLDAGELDLMVDMAVSPERETRFAFSREPVLVNWGAAFSRSDLRIGSFLDMADRTVAVMRESVHTEGDRGIKALTKAFGVPCRFIEVDDYHEVMMLLDARQADVGIVNRLFGTLHGGDYDVAATPIVFNPQVLVFGARKDDARGQTLLEAIDATLAAEKQAADSAYHQILSYYLGGGTRVRMGRTEQYLRRLDLPPELAAWLRAHPVIRFGVDPGFAPFEMLTPDGEFRGMAADVLRLVSQMTGLRFERVGFETWPETVQAVRDGTLDLLPCIGFSEERRQFLVYSRPYLNFARVIVTRLDSPVAALGDLDGKTVAVQTESSHHAFLKEHTSLDPRLFDTFAAGLLAVSRGEADAVIGNLAVATHFIRELGLTNLKLAGYAAPEPQALAFGVRKDWPELAAILDLALDAISQKQRNEILARWLPLPRAADASLDLTQAEREWLLMHPRIRVAWDRGWAPIEFAAPDGSPQGISMEYLAALEDMLGVEFAFAPAADWQTTYGKLLRRELDMSSCLGVTEERLRHFDFTESYMESPVVFFARDDTPYLRGMEDLKGLTVAVVEGYATHEWIRRDHPDLALVSATSIADAFERLRRGEVDVFIENVLAGNYYLSLHHHRNIQIAGETPYLNKLRMAVRNDWPEFSGILRKALRALPESDKTAFYRKWVWLRYEHGFDYSLFGWIVCGALAVILVFVYWNRRLKTEVTRRRDAQEALARSEAALRDSYADLKKVEALKDNLVHMIVHDMRSPLSTVTGALDLMDASPGDGDRTERRLARAGLQRLTGMVQALLDISRLEAGQMPLNRTDLDLRNALDDAVRDMAIQANLAGVTLAVSGDGTRAHADPDILHRILANLIGNALKASPQGASVELRCYTDGNRAVLDVQDHGRGIPREFHATLFEKFTTVENGGPQKTSVGLGLAFCKLAVRAHGGEIMVDSEPGQGSTFRIVLPRSETPAPGVESQS